MKIITIIGSWLLFIAIIAGIFFTIEYLNTKVVYLPELHYGGQMPGYLVIVFAFSLAFVWVEVLRWWKRIKPFNCLTCMCGWLSLLIAFVFHTPYWFFYLAVGATVGAIFSAFKNRWL